MTTLVPTSPVADARWPGSGVVPPRTPAHRTEVAPKRLPLTAAQREIWFASQLSPAAALAYHESSTLRLTGTLHQPALAAALQRLIARHEALRASISAAGDAQVIAPTVEVAMAWRDLSSTEPDAREAAAADCIALHLDHPFDLTTGPLFRVLLLRLEPQTHLLVFIVHHIVCDGWSLGVLQRELGELYSAYTLGREQILPAPSSFLEYVESEVGREQTASYRAAEAFWKAQFAGEVPATDLPTDRARATARTFEGRLLLRALPADLAGSVKRVCAERQCTPFAVMFAAFNLLLHRLTGQDDLVVGVPAAGQVMAGRVGLVGHFANLLPLRSRYRGDQRFSEYLEQCRLATTAALEHWEYPFGQLVQALNLPRDASRVPLAPVVFNATSRTAVPRFAGLAVELESNPKRFVNFDLNFNFVVGRESILMGAQYSTELFERPTIERWFDHFATLLRAAATHPDERVSKLPLLNEAQRAQMLVAWNDTALAYRRNACIHELFAEQVGLRADAVAVVCGRERVTYGDLERRAERIAARLTSEGVGPDVLVGVYLERTPQLIAGMLGVLKAGGAYVPFDRAAPTERLAFMIRDTQMRVVVTQRSLLRYLPPLDVRLVVVDDDAGAVRQAAPECHAAQPTGPTAENLAYVIYTSGSTGQPKGVCVMHRGVVALAAWAKQFYRPEDLDGVLFATAASFDVSVFESLVPLCLGGKVIMAEDILQLPSLPAVDEVRLVSGVPSAVGELVRTRKLPLCVRTVNVAGEPCPQSLVEALYALPQIERVVDVYGPTETTVYSTGSIRRPGGRPTIGRPLPNERVYILDAQQQPVPTGVRGELYIGGEKVARGYLHRPELTAERFITSPFVAGERLYRTGDVARFNVDGTIEFLGRMDHQVKLRGFRIELGEIETILAQHPSVAEAVVVVRNDGASGAPRLVAYVATRGGTAATAAELREHVGKRLPDYMVPAAFVALPELPRTTSGKIDRRALPEPERNASAALRVAPRSETEEIIADVWREVLGVAELGVHDNFFELGGHSLLAAQVIARIHDALGVELSMRQFFIAPTIATLAQALESALIEDITSGASEPPPAPMPPPAKDHT